MENVTMKILYLGNIKCNRFRLIQTDDESAMILSPMMSILIRHPTLGNILYDTGNDPNWRECYSAHIQEIYPVNECIPIVDALAGEGLTVDDIDKIIISHMHFDHVGGLKYFAGTKAGRDIIVSRQDLTAALLSVYTGEENSAYLKCLFDLDGITFAPIEEDTDLGAGLHLFIQPSHTPGVTGLRVETKNNGTILCVSDTIYLKEGYEKRLPPGGHINKTTQEYFDHVDRIAAMAERYKAKILFGHDYDQVMEWSKAIID